MARAVVGQPEESELKRVIGRKVLLLFVVGDILGAGIYALVGQVAGEVGGAIWLPFLVAFVLASLTATAYAELVGKYPRASGAALYTHKAFGLPFVTFMVAFTVMMSGVTSASAAARAFGGRYLAEFITLPVIVGALAFLVLVTLVNLAGISESIKVNVVLTAIEAFGLLVIVAIGIWALIQGDGEPARALEFHPHNGAILGVLGGTALAFYALLGFEDSVNLAEEAKNPQADFPRALFGGLAVTAVVYLAVAFTATMLVDTKTLEASTGPLLEVVKVAGFSFPPKLFALIALLAVGNTALINMIMASRLVYGMAREGIVPSVLGKVAPVRATPWTAILFTVAVAVVLVSTGDIAGLADTTVLLLLLVFALVNVCVLLLRRDPVDHPHFRAPSWMPALGAVVCLVLASPLTGRDPDVYIRAATLIAIGILLWLANYLYTRYTTGRLPRLPPPRPPTNPPQRTQHAEKVGRLRSHVLPHLRTRALAPCKVSNPAHTSGKGSGDAATVPRRSRTRQSRPDHETVIEVPWDDLTEAVDLDGERVMFNHFSGVGDWVGVEWTKDVEIAELCGSAFDAVWSRATPHEEYRAA